MIGRASIGNPWIFYEIKHNEKVSDKIKKEIILCHFDEMIKHYKNQGIVIFRKHLHQYSKGYDGASEFELIISLVVTSQPKRFTTPLKAMSENPAKGAKKSGFLEKSIIYYLKK